MHKNEIFKILVSIITVVILIFGVFIINFLHKKTHRPTLRVFSCGNYIDKSIVINFEKEYKIKVIYQTFDSNENMYTKFKLSSLAYDILIPSDYTVDRLIQENMLLELDKSQITNFKNIDSEYLNRSFDDKNRYSVPYLTGTLGILYNKKLITDKIDSFSSLFQEKYKKKIFMLDSERDSIGIALKCLGYSMNSENISEINRAIELLQKQKPLVLAYISDDIRDKMINNEAYMSLCYSGDAIFAMKENSDLEYIVPKEGSNAWIDSMVISKFTKLPIQAHTFINYMCRDDVAFKNSEFTGHASPNTKIKNDYSNKYHKYLYITNSNNENYLYVGPELQKIYSNGWLNVKLDLLRNS